MRTRPVVVTASIFIASLIWVGTVTAAFRAIAQFESTPCRAADGPSAWPAASSLVRTKNAPTLVMLVHPQCSCTRASLSELEAAIEKSPRNMRIYVLVFRPRDAKPGWERSDTFSTATRLRGTRVIVDEDGREAKRFGMFTSGQTLLYDADGHLRFEGGITLLRGHVGLNSGREDVIRIANGEAAKGTNPVFGCSIVSKGEKR
ncbi:MAG: RedB protein [Thermoanaerobaculia bacterium]